MTEDAVSNANGGLTPADDPTFKHESGIVLPKPTSKEQLEQLVYRYRAIVTRPKENHLEIAAIKNVLDTISTEQDVFESKLDLLRNNAASVGTPIDSHLLQRQLMALQLLERDMDLPLALIESLVPSISSGPEGQKETSSKNDELFKPIKITANFEENAENLGVAHRFQSSTATVLNDPKVESLVSLLISKRMEELEKLPGNLGTYSLDDCLEFVTKNELPSGIDMLKIRALIELKSLKLLTKQKALRKKLITNVSSQAHHNVACLRDSPYTLTAQRSVQIRSKVIVPQTVRLAEELERQQLVEKRKRERNLHLQKVHSIVRFIKNRKSRHWTQSERCAQFGKQCTTLHGQLERDEQKRIERTAKQRLVALKSNDEEAYLKLLDQTKDTRITQLLSQTNQFLDSLAQAVTVQQNEAKVLKGEEIKPLTNEEREKVDYYEVAHRVKEKVTKQPNMLVGGTLKEYQVRGLEWMVSLYNNNLNGILADEMGLGKTIQSISLITYLYEVKNEPGPYLVMVPLSTITNWTMEFEKWAPSLKTIVYKGTPNQRHGLQNQIKSGNFDVLLTTYEYIIKDKSLLGKHDWTHMIIDEGHRMKNAQSKLSYTISRFYKTQNRLILTGTPLQNNLPELWALLNFVLPKIFNSAKTFEDWFNTPFANTGGGERLELTEEETLLIIRRLHKVLRPFLLRRLKKEVEKDLPDKVEKVLKCKLSGLQQHLYEQMLKHNALFVGAGTEGATKGGIKGLNNKIMQLRKICNHPFVFDEVEGVINPSRDNSELLYRVAGKFELLDRVLPKFNASGHRVLIFFQMTQVMDIMEDFLRMRDLKYMRLDGSTKADTRTGMLNEFNAPDSEYFCFLLSTRAGGLGLNLQTADTVIIFDTDWNPHQDLQAQDRAHRIGQKNEVRILRLITSDTVEEVILERAMQKLDIDGKVIQAGKFDNKSTAEEQEAFLRRLLENESSNEENDNAELDDSDLNEILARTEDEKEMFDRMDREREERERQSAKAAGFSKALPRLIQYDELPEIFTEDISKHLDIEEVTLGRIRQTKKVYYDDGLTEEQFLNAVEDESNSLEDVITKRRKARESREKNRKVEELDNEDDDDKQETIARETEVSEDETIKPPTRPKKRRAASGPPIDKVETGTDHANYSASAEIDSTPDLEERDTKKPRLKVKFTIKQKPENNSSKTDIKSLEPLKVTQVAELIDAMREQLDSNDAHPRTEVFEKLPSKKLYPNYYEVIQQPIALENIMKKCKRGQYSSLEDVRADLQLMYDNARFFNEEGSWIYVDADELNKFTDKWLDEHK